MTSAPSARNAAPARTEQPKTLDMFTRHQDPLRGLLAARRDLGSEAVKIVCAALMLALIVLAWRITSALV